MDTDDDVALPDLPSVGSPYVMTFPFAIADIGIERGGGLRFRAAARAGERRVGFTLAVVPSEQRGMAIPASGATFQRAYAELGSSGVETDALLHVFAKLWGVAIAPDQRARPNLTFEAVSLKGDPKRLFAGPNRLKVFYADPQEAAREQTGFELMMEIDVRSRSIQLVEKWTRYRHAFVRAMTFVPARDAN